MKWRVVIVGFIVLAAAVIVGGTVAGQQPAPPTDYTGTLDGTAYKIRVPANWNGTLLVFAHGTQLGAPTPVVAPPNVEAQLLASGYALAGSGFTNSYQDGVQQTHALTGFFRKTVANPQRIIIWGNSLGGGISLNLIEKYPGLYDGAIANCAPAAGAVENMDSALAFSLAYDAAFGWPEDLWGPVGDVRDDLTVSDVLPLTPPLTPENTPKWEFVRLVMHLPPAAFWTIDPGSKYPFYMLQLWKATVLRSAAEAENGGPVAENRRMRYTVEADDATLVSLGLTREQVDGMLDYMNERANIEADRPARRHLAQWGAPSGFIRRPVLTMHYTDDGMAFATTESYYKAQVEAAGDVGDAILAWLGLTRAQIDEMFDQMNARFGVWTNRPARRRAFDAAADPKDLLLQTYVTGPAGHCSFTPNQYLTALAAMNAWLDSGERPGASFFPAAPPFFFNAGFTPGPWIF
jgi:pimeloyl-ACP methyl ester carboxylesterase